MINFTICAKMATSFSKVLQGYTKGIRLIALLTMLCTIGVGQMWGALTKEISSFSATSGTIGDVTYTSYKGGGTSNPAVNSNAIRLYQNANGNTGGYIVLSVPDGYKITSATIKSTMKTTTGYYIDSNPGSTAPTKANFEVSNYSLSTNTAYTVSGLSTQHITFACFGTTSSSRLYLSYLSVTYEAEGGGSTPTPSLTATPTTIDFGTVEQGATVDSKTIAVDFENLTSNVTYSGLSTPFTASGSISNSGDNITIAANTSTIGDYSQTLTIASAADDKSVEVAVKMNVIAPFEGKKLVFDFVTHPSGWPATKANTAAGNYVYTLDEVDYTFTHTKTGDGIYLGGTSGTSGYLLVYNGCKLGLPAIKGYKLVKVDGTLNGSGTPSTAAQVSITNAGGTIVNGGTAQTWDTKGGIKTYNLTDTEANTMYYLTVANKNLQMITLALYYEEVAGAAEIPDAPVLTESQTFETEIFTVSISAADGTTIHYTTDGTEPTEASTTYSTPFTINATTTVKAIAVKGGVVSSVATATYTKLTVIEKNCAEAAALCTSSTESTEIYLVEGYVTEIVSEYNSTYNNNSFWMADTRNGGQVLQAYRVSPQVDADKTVQVGDKVSVKGHLKLYNSTREIVNGNFTITVPNPKYNVNITSAHGTVTATPASAVEGTEITLSVEVESGWVFQSWTVTDASSNPIEVTENKFTMPASDVTVVANYTASVAPDAVLTLMANGNQLSQETYKQGETVELPATIANDCVKQFVGWSTNANCAVAPEYAPGADFELTAAEHTLYAVYASGGSGETVTIKHNLAADATAVNLTEENAANTYFNLDANDWSIVGAKGSASNNIGLNKDGTTRLYYHADGGNTLTITAPSKVASIQLDLVNNYNNAWVKVDGNTVTPIDGVYTIDAETFVIGNAYTTNTQVRINSITVTLAGDFTGYSTTCEVATPDLETYTITFVTNGGTTVDQLSEQTALPNPLPETTRTHYNFAGWYTDEGCTQAAVAGATITSNTTLYAKWTPITYTVTFNAGSGTCGTTTMTGNFETGITLPTATPCPYAQENGWSFVGWSESTVSETTVRPVIHTGTYKPTKNITLHAVYAKTEAGQGGANEFILSLQHESTTYYVGQTYDSGKLSAETDQNNAARFTIEDNFLHYEGGYISHVAESSANLTKKTDKAEAQGWTINEDGTNITFTSTTANTGRLLAFHYNNGSPRFAAYVIDGDKYPYTFTKTSVSGGNVQVTTYNSKPSCEAPVDPTWGDVQITHTAIKANCGSTTVLGSEGENGPATISFDGTDLQSSVTVTASDGFLVSTDKTAPEKYAKSVIIYPNSTGNNIGQITQNVHVIADATAKNESYTGTITLTGNDIPGGSQVINVTADVTCTTYTITWSVNGDDSHQVTYSPGDALQLPEIDVTPCDGMDHVGWTDNMGYVHETNILFTETTDMTVTSDKTYYAVFAASTSSDGGETTLNFSEQGYSNGEAVTSLTSDGVTVEFDKGSGSTAPAYYDSGSAVRVYANGTFTVSSGNTISKIVITFGTSDKTNEITTNKGTYSEGTWTGSENSVIFTVGGTKDHRRIQSITVTSAGDGASYYTGHTTTCSGSQQLGTPTNLQATDITHNSATLKWDAVAGANKYKVVINGTEYISNINSYTTHALKQQTAYTWTVQAIGNGTTFTDSEISAEATFTTGTELVITWSVSTITSTTTITKGQPIGANLKTPATPAGCEGKYFMGWSATNTVKSDGSDFTPITSATVPETNVTYYAVFAEPTGNGGAEGELFSESFNTMNGKGGNDGTWNGISSNTEVSIDGWSFTKGYVANQCIRLGTGSVAGEATTPALDINGNATLTFAAGAWNGNSENLTINLQIVGEGRIEPSSVTLTKGQFNTYTANITGANADTKVKFSAAIASNNRFFLDEVKVSGGSSDSYTDYSTSCGTYTVTFYGFEGGFTTDCTEDPDAVIVPQGDTYQIPDCTPTQDPQGLGRTFAGTWNTQANGKGTAYEPGDEFIVNSDITLYAQWALNTSENTTLPTDVEDLATTDIIVTGGTTLTLQAGTTTINSLTLKGGLQENGSYAMPVVNIPEGATLVRNNNKINLDLVVNNDSWYPFAVPFEVENTAANVNYINPTLKEYANANKGYGKYYRILEYNGALRAENGVNSNENWVHVGRSNNEKLVPGKGYAISAVPASGQDTVTIRIAMTVDNAWLADGEQESITVKEQTTTRNQIAVEAHTGTATDINKGGHQRHAGWNFVANPYLTNFAGTNASNKEGAFINGEILINNGEYSYGGEDVPYVTIPTYNFAHYYQQQLSEATLSPAYGFFVQVGTSGTMDFTTTGRQQAPASIAARAEERPVKMDVDITLSDNHSSDQTGIIISDRYNDTYEIGRDLEKMFGSANNLTVYTLMADNTPLAFQALAIRSSMQVIPVGYRAPEQGEYTFRLNEATSSIDLLNEQYEQLVLVDYQTGELTNLLIADYTFYSERVQSDSRFALYAVPRQNAPTDLPNAIGQDKEAQKIIHNGHLYILRDGNVYNGNGQIVK